MQGRVSWPGLKKNREEERMGLALGQQSLETMDHRRCWWQSVLLEAARRMV